MKKYMFVPVTPYFKIGKNEMTDHREAIFHYASLGYRFVAAIPTEINSNGISLKMDLVFEIDEEDVPEAPES